MAFPRRAREKSVLGPLISPEQHFSSCGSMAVRDSQALRSYPMTYPYLFSSSDTNGCSDLPFGTGSQNLISDNKEQHTYLAATVPTMSPLRQEKKEALPPSSACFAERREVKDLSTTLVATEEAPINNTTTADFSSGESKSLFKTVDSQLSFSPNEDSGSRASSATAIPITGNSQLDFSELASLLPSENNEGPSASENGCTLLPSVTDLIAGSCAHKHARMVAQYRESLVQSLLECFDDLRLPPSATSTATASPRAMAASARSPHDATSDRNCHTMLGVFSALPGTEQASIPESSPFADAVPKEEDGTLITSSFSSSSSSSSPVSCFNDDSPGRRLARGGTVSSHTVSLAHQTVEKEQVPPLVSMKTTVPSTSTSDLPVGEFGEGAVKTTDTTTHALCSLSNKTTFSKAAELQVQSESATFSSTSRSHQQQKKEHQQYIISPFQSSPSTNCVALEPFPTWETKGSQTLLSSSASSSSSSSSSSSYSTTPRTQRQSLAVFPPLSSATYDALSINDLLLGDRAERLKREDAGMAHLFPDFLNDQHSLSGWSNRGHPTPCLFSPLEDASTAVLGCVPAEGLSSQELRRYSAPSATQCAFKDQHYRETAALPPLAKVSDNLLDFYCTLESCPTSQTLGVHCIRHHQQEEEQQAIPPSEGYLHTLAGDAHQHVLATSKVLAPQPGETGLLFSPRRSRSCTMPAVPPHVRNGFLFEASGASGSGNTGCQGLRTTPLFLPLSSLGTSPMLTKSPQNWNTATGTASTTRTTTSSISQKTGRGHGAPARFSRARSSVQDPYTTMSATPAEQGFLPYSKPFPTNISVLDSLVEHPAPSSALSVLEPILKPSQLTSGGATTTSGGASTPTNFLFKYKDSETDDGPFRSPKSVQKTFSNISSNDLFQSTATTLVAHPWSSTAEDLVHPASPSQEGTLTWEYGVQKSGGVSTSILTEEQQQSHQSQQTQGNNQNPSPSVSNRQEQERLHPQGRCKPCAFFYNKKKGCRNGDACNFCHHEDHSKLALKQWKKQQQKVMKLAKEGRLNSATTTGNVGANRISPPWTGLGSPPLQPYTLAFDGQISKAVQLPEASGSSCPMNAPSNPASTAETGVKRHTTPSPCRRVLGETGRRLQASLSFFNHVGTQCPGVSSIRPVPVHCAHLTPVTRSTGVDASHRLNGKETESLLKKGKSDALSSSPYIGLASCRSNEKVPPPLKKEESPCNAAQRYLRHHHNYHHRHSLPTLSVSSKSASCVDVVDNVYNGGARAGARYSNGSGYRENPSHTIPKAPTSPIFPSQHDCPTKPQQQPYPYLAYQELHNNASSSLNDHQNPKRAEPRAAFQPWIMEWLAEEMRKQQPENATPYYYDQHLRGASPSSSSAMLLPHTPTGVLQNCLPRR